MDTGTELADLRARAYGPDAVGLTSQERARLSELEASHRVARPRTSDPRPGAAPASPPAPAASASAPTATLVDPVLTVDTAEAVERARRPLLAAVVILAALVPAVAVGGYLAGAVLSAPVDTAAAEPMLVGQFPPARVEASRDRALDDHAWDDGDVRLLGGAEGHLVWWGTTDRGARTCVAVEGAFVDVLSSCEPTDQVRSDGIGLGMHLQFIEAPDADASADADADMDAPSGQMTLAVQANPYAGTLVIVRTEPRD